MPDNYYSEFNENGVVTPFRDLAAYNGIIANTKLIKDTVGWSGKNKWVTDLFTTKTAVGYTATVDPITKKIHITGTHDTETAGVIECGLIHLEAGTYKLSGGIGGISQKLGLQVWASSAYSDQWYSFDNSEVTMILATAKDCKLRIWFSGVTSNVDVTFEPMIRSSDILDDTYEPYFGSTAFPRSEQAVLGAKNIIPFPYVQSSVSSDGVTFTSDGEGVVTVNATQSTGTPEMQLTPYITDNRYEGMILSDGGSSTNNNYMRIREALSDGTFVRELSVSDNKLVIPHMESGHKYYIGIRVSNTGVALNNVKFYPMISFDDGEYAPPTMTNKELTEKVQGIINAASNAADFAAFKTAIGNL